MIPARKRVLIVDDSPLMLEMAKDALIAAGFDARTASDMSELESLDWEGPDLVLMDVQMPELFGDDVAMVLRSVQGVDAPIYLFSSLDASELQRRADDAEIDGYICKGEGIDAMVARVREIFLTRHDAEVGD